MDSTIAREADGVLYTHAGPEISIASTKAFTAQMAVLFLFARLSGPGARQARQRASAAATSANCSSFPAKTETVLESASELAERSPTGITRWRIFLFLGRAIHYPVAMDGALKLKEVSYIHAEGYPTGETKHGPNAHDRREPAGGHYRHLRPRRRGFGAALREECWPISRDSNGSLRG